MTPESLPAPILAFLAGRRKWAILVVLVLVLATAAVALLRRPGTTDQNPKTTTEMENSQNGTATGSKTFQQVTVPVVADADKDGLPDQRENELKTNPRLADTDGDKLSDYDEVEIYRTDPLKQDTDGDGFPDGEEVQTGNNPSGSGSLRNLPQTIVNINAQ